jgi:prepilin peptidase CpaA
MWYFLASVLLLVICGAAVLKDVRERRIPNALALGALAMGVLTRIPAGWEAVGSGLAAVGLAFVFGFLFFLLGGLGAGDVKFMSGLAAFLGLEGLLMGLVVMALTGGAMAVVAAVRQGALRGTLKNLFLIGVTFGKDSFKGWKGESPAASLARPGPGAVRNPYGVAIAAGAMAGWFAPLLGWTL